MLCGVAAATVGCGGSIDLDVDLKTDLVPAEEFAVVTTTVLEGPGGAAGRVTETTVSARDDFVRGARMASFGDIAAGDYTLRMRLARSTGLLVVERNVRVHVAESLVVTVVATRSCRDVTCPAAGGDPVATACFGGRCVSPECVLEHPEACGPAACTTDTDCPAMATCALPRCVAGSCLLEPHADRCPAGQFCSPELGCRAGTVDAGPLPDGGDARDSGTCDACDDGDPCTDDVCGAGACLHTTRDRDGDGFGDSACPSRGGLPADDCDDGNIAVHPGAVDVCNGLDDDCSGATDPGCGCTPGEWQSGTIDGRGIGGAYISLVAGQDGALHAAYYETSGQRDVLYAYHGPNGWWSTAAQADLIGQPAALAYTRDAAATEHLAYYESSNRDLWYGRRAAGEVVWELTSVDATGIVGQAPSLALGTGDSVHTSYYDATNRDLKYATRSGAGAWSPETVDAAGDAGAQSSIAAAPDGTVAIAYRDATEDDLEWAERAPGAGAWTRATIDRDGGTSPSLVLDPTGRPHVVYRVQGMRLVRHAARNPDGTWTTELVATNADVAAARALAIGADGTLYVAYRVESSRDLAFAEKLPGGTWTTLPLDATSQNAGLFASIGVDATGGVHIAYQDDSNVDLAYAYRAPGAATFDTETAEFDATQGLDAVMGVDSSGTVFVMHLVTLRGAPQVWRSWRPQGGVWHREVATATGNVGEHTDLALGPSGSVHVAYYDASTRTAKDVVRTSPGAPWAVETIDASANAGTFTSLEIDSAGVAHAAYYDAANLVLRYARRDATTGAWTSELAAGPARAHYGQFASLTLGTGGEPRVLFYDDNLRDLELVERAAGGTWSAPASIDSTGNTGRYISSMVAPDGQLWAAFASSGDSLRVGVRSAGGGWTIEPAATFRTVSVDETSLLAAADGRIVVSYRDATRIGCDPTTGLCSYVDALGAWERTASGTWSSIAPPVSLGGGGYTALAEPDGQLFIAYYDPNGRRLRFVRRCR